MDATIYALVLHPALHDLLQVASGGAPVSDSDIGWYGGIVFSIFLVGWAIGGGVFGGVAGLFRGAQDLFGTNPVFPRFTRDAGPFPGRGRLGPFLVPPA